MDNKIVLDLYADSCPSYAFWSDWLKDDVFPPAVALLSNKKLLNSTACNLRNRASKKYYCTILSMDERNRRLEQIHEVNTSMAIRQGREMSEGYKQYPKIMTGVDTCDNHYSRWFAVFETETDKLVGYIAGQFCGQISAMSMILGHGNYLKDGIMYLLVDFFYTYSIRKGIKAVIYGKWDSGTSGLKTFKHNIGMRDLFISELK